MCSLTGVGERMHRVFAGAEQNENMVPMAPKSSHRHTCVAVKMLYAIGTGIKSRMRYVDWSYKPKTFPHRIIIGKMM